MTSLSERIAHEVAVEWDEAWRAFSLNTEARLELADEARVKARRILAVAIESYPDAMDDLTGMFDLTAMFSLQVLRDLGEGYALISEAWPIGSEADPKMPDRDVVERHVRLASIDGPAVFRSGIELITPVSGGDNRGSGPPHNMIPAEEHKSAHDLANAFSGYPTFLALLAFDRGRVALQKRRFEMRQDLCMTMSLCRRGFDLLGLFTNRGGARRLAVLLQLLLLDSRFLAYAADSTDECRDLPVIPLDFVRKYIRNTGVDTWLAHHGAQLSDDLR